MAFINEIKDNFTIIPNGIFGDLTIKEIGILTYIASKPTNWKFASERIAIGTRVSKRTVDLILNNLERKGYLQRSKRNTGRMDYKLLYPPVLSSKGQKAHRAECAQSRNCTEQKAHRAETNPLYNTIINSNTINKEKLYIPEDSGTTFSKASKYHHNNEHLAIAFEFSESKKKTHGHLSCLKKFKLEQWAEEIYKLEHLDNKNLDTIKGVLLFAINDTFWTNNLISLKGIRKKNSSGISKFEQIELKYGKPTPVNNDNISKLWESAK